MSSRIIGNKSKAALKHPRAQDSSLPEVQISYSPAGHETLAAITEELLTGPIAPAVAPSPAHDDAPELSFAEAPVGRETLALIAEEARPLRAQQDTRNYGDRTSNAPRAKAPSRAPSAQPAQPFAIFEMLTFVVQGPPSAELSSDALRRRFVEEHLLQRLPAQNMAQVERIDVTPWTVRGTVVVRVWCKL